MIIIHVDLQALPVTPDPAITNVDVAGELQYSVCRMKSNKQKSQEVTVSIK